jgi:hypothetical protein
VSAWKQGAFSELPGDFLAESLPSGTGWVGIAFRYGQMVVTGKERGVVLFPLPPARKTLENASSTRSFDLERPALCASGGLFLIHTLCRLRMAVPTFWRMAQSFASHSDNPSRCAVPGMH